MQETREESGLKLHEKMYQKRLGIVETRGGKSITYLINRANDPRIFKRANDARSVCGKKAR